jgi:hypothetical protein
MAAKTKMIAGGRTWTRVRAPKRWAPGHGEVLSERTLHL